MDLSHLETDIFFKYSHIELPKKDPLLLRKHFTIRFCSFIYICHHFQNKDTSDVSRYSNRKKCGNLSNIQLVVSILMHTISFISLCSLDMKAMAKTFKKSSKKARFLNVL